MSSNTPLNKIIAFNAFSTGEHGLVKLKAKEGFKPDKTFCDEETYVGIEVEVEQVLSDKNVLFSSYLDRYGEEKSVAIWKNIEDGSLRNSGREFVSVPLKGENIIYALQKLKQSLTKDKNCSGHEFTERTSVHVHVDARDLSVEQICSMLLLYSAVEPLMYNYCGGQRHKNIFCVPLNQANITDNIGLIYSNMEMGGSSTALEYINRWHKYTGFNLKPIRTKGTIEFRHMRGNLDVDNITSWINLILRLRNYAKANRFADIKKTVLSLNTTSEYLMFVREIFREDSDLVYTDNSPEHLEDMVIFIKDCFGFQTIDKVGEYVNSSLIKPKDFFMLSVAKAMGYIIAPKSKVTKTDYEAFYNELDVVTQQEVTNATRGNNPNFTTTEGMNWTTRIDEAIAFETRPQTGEPIEARPVEQPTPRRANTVTAEEFDVLINRARQAVQRGIDHQVNIQASRPIRRNRNA